MEKTAFRYLTEEVRDGFMVPAHVKQAWAADLSVFKEIDRICCKHGISYFADWGTLLGTVRHGGIIPWDDDIDIVMKREDYLRFLEVSKAEFRQGFTVLTYRNQQPDNWMFMGKVVNKDRICFEPEHLRSFYNYPFIASVDIFVLDYVYEDPALEKRRCDLCLYMLGVANAIIAGSLKGIQIKNNLEHIKKTWGLSIPFVEDSVEMGRYLYGAIEKQFAVVSSDESTKLCQLFPWGLKGNARVYPKEYYEKAIRLPFEDTTMPVPLAFDSMLRARYGEYLRIFRNGGAHEYPNFEVQKKSFMASTGVTLPKYVFEQNEINYRKIVAPVLENEELPFKEMLGYGIEQVCVPETMEEIVELQQNAIDWGNLIEEVKGQGHESIGYLERYCELLYAVYELLGFENMENDSDNGKKQELAAYLEEIELSVNHFRECVKRTILDRRLNVFFVVYDFERVAIEPFIKKLLQDENEEVILVVLNYYRKDYDGTLVEYWNDYDAWKMDDAANVTILKQDDMPIERLAFLQPDRIFITNGYDRWNENVSLHPAYYSEHLLMSTKELVYVSPYVIEPFARENEKAYTNLQYYVLCPGLVRADKIIVSDELIRERYIEKLTEFCGNDTARHWEDTIVTCSKMFSKEDDSSESKKKLLLYCISLSNVLEKGNQAIDKITKSLEILKGAEGIELHVSTFPELSEEIKLLDEGLYSSLMHTLGEFRVTPECLADIEISKIDAYYGDGSPLAAKCMGMNKTIMVQNYEI